VSRHESIDWKRGRIWSITSGLLLVAITVWVMSVAFNHPIPTPNPAGTGANTAGAPASQSSGPAPIPTRDFFLRPGSPHFGLTTAQSPWSVSEINRLSAKAGAHPTIIQFFVKWSEDFRPDAVEMCYRQHALPLMSWEPWDGVSHGQTQPKYALSKIIHGDFDAYITRFATAVSQQKWPVAIRFAHEMNGNWYPWSETRSGNRPGEYKMAWRHVHDIFNKVGATNVIWVWSPNIVRPVPAVRLQPLYPGDAYVDWVGVVGYQAHEETAGQVFDPTLKLLRKFTKKPILITETGAEPGPQKASWTASLFPWLRHHPDVVGFVWFELSKSEGANADWRFAVDSKVLHAFHDGIVQSQLAPPLTYTYRLP
jgi:hypothetical protein